MSNFEIKNASGDIVFDDVTPMLVFRTKSTMTLSRRPASLGYPAYYSSTTTYTVGQIVAYILSPPNINTEKWFTAKTTTVGHAPQAGGNTWWTDNGFGDVPLTYWMGTYTCGSPISQRPIIAVVASAATYLTAFSMYSLDGTTMLSDIYMNDGTALTDPSDDMQPSDLSTDPETKNITVYEFAITTNSDKTTSGFYGLETYDASGNLLYSSKFPTANITNAIWTGAVHYAPWSPTYTDTIYDSGKLLEAIPNYSGSRTYAICNPISKQAVWADASFNQYYLYTAGCRITSGNVVAVTFELYRSPDSLGALDRGWQPNPTIFDVTGL